MQCLVRYNGEEQAKRQVAETFSEEFRDYFRDSSGIAKSAYLRSEALASREEKRLLFPCSTIFEQNLCHRKTIVAQLFRRVKEKEKRQMATDSNNCHDFEKLVLTRHR